MKLVRNKMILFIILFIFSQFSAFSQKHKQRLVALETPRSGLVQKVSQSINYDTLIGIEYSYLSVFNKILYVSKPEILKHGGSKRKKINAYFYNFTIVPPYGDLICWTDSIYKLEARKAVIRYDSENNLYIKLKFKNRNFDKKAIQFLKQISRTELKIINDKNLWVPVFNFDSILVIVDSLKNIRNNQYLLDNDREKLDSLISVNECKAEAFGVCQNSINDFYLCIENLQSHEKDSVDNCFMPTFSLFDFLREKSLSSYSYDCKFDFTNEIHDFMNFYCRLKGIRYWDGSH